jgi:flagellar basal body-associated protein FliL
MSGPLLQRHDPTVTGELFSLSRDELIKRVLALMRDNERLQGEIKRSTEEVADLQFQLLRHQTSAAGTKPSRYPHASFPAPPLPQT